MKTLRPYFFLILWLTAMSGFSQTDNVAVNFNTTDNYITLSGSAAFNIPGAMTVEAWFRVDHFDKAYQAIITKGNTSWKLERWANTNFLQFKCGGDSVQGSININDGLWHHVAAGLNALDYIFLIVDGEVDAQKNVMVPVTPGNNIPVCIGENIEKQGRFFYGQVDEVRIWNYDRTLSQIRENMNLQALGNELLLEAYYRMDHNFYHPAYLDDYTGNGHTGFLANTYGNYQVFSGVIFATPPSEGDGSIGNPYKLDSIAELFWITQNADRWDKNYIQTGNIDATNTASLYGGKGMIPIGNTTTRFTGTYDGRNYTINALLINRPDEEYVGLFGNTWSAELTNIRLTDASVTGKNYVGGIAGLLSGYSEMNKCTFSGSVSGTDRVGGLAGRNSYNSSILNCSNSSTVYGEDYVGGVVGDNWSAAWVKRCYNEGAVTGTGTNCGGIVGYNHSNAYVFNSYNTGTVSGNTAAGGLVGNNTSSVDKCYSLGPVSGSVSPGGLIGIGFGTVMNSFWNTETSGQNSSNGGYGKTSAQMKNVNLYTVINEIELFAPWDFITDPNDDDATEGTWNIDPSGIINNGYPIISWQAPVPSAPSGSGASDDPYLIANLNNLVWMSQNIPSSGKYFEQTTNIPADDTWGWESKTGFCPIGNSTTAFGGFYNGQKYTIDKLHFTRFDAGYIGLFGWINGSSLQNITLTDVEIFASVVGGCTACLVALAENSTISGCKTDGQITAASANAGGLAGYVRGNSVIEFCAADVSVTGLAIGYLPNRIGGFTGCLEESEISNCYARGASSGAIWIGGFAGENISSAIDKCYSTGAVAGSGSDVGGMIGENDGGTNTNSFWDTETSGFATSAGGTGKTTAEMKTLSTFTSAGWDFYTSPVWAIDGMSNDGYPYLSTELNSIIWTGAVNADWNTAGNWSGNKVPGELDNVMIPAREDAPLVNQPSATPALCNNLNIQTGGNLTLGAGKALTVNGSLTNGGTMTVESDASGTGSLIASGAIAGEISVKQYISNGVWHLFSPPVAGIEAGLFMNNFLQWYEEPENQWTDIVDPETALNAAQGYSLWNLSKAQTFTFHGVPHTGQFNLSAFSTPALTSTAGKGEGWNLIGNPYPSAIDWDKIYKNNIDATVYVWDAAYGNYISWNGTTGSLSDGIIPAMNGFFVKASPGVNMSIQDSSRVHAATGFYKNTKEVKNLFAIKIEGNGFTDKTYVQFQETATSGFDTQLDAWKLAGDDDAPQFYSSSEGNDLSINVLPFSDEEVEIPLNLEVGKETSCKITVEENSFSEMVDLVLEDLFTGEKYDLNSQTEIIVNHTPGISSERFSLVINGVTGIEPIHKNENNINIYSYNKQIYIKTIHPENLEVRVTNLLGQQVFYKKYYNQDEVIIEMNAKPGFYLVRVNTDRIAILRLGYR